MVVYTTRAPPPRSPVNSQSSYSAHHATTVTHDVPRLSTGAAASQHSQSPSVPASSDNIQPEDARASLPASHHTTYVQRTIGEALGEHNGSDSPVMNETLNVIDEHITDLSSPRHKIENLPVGGDSDSDYSTYLERHSFMAGPETDEEDNGGLDEATVRSWDHNQTAQHLRDIGVDPKHCDIFLEQEISGDVLLDMDQNFVYMKEFDFGVMGKRLKTWHKIRDFQREVKSHAPASRKSSSRGQNSSIEDFSRVGAQPVSSSSLARFGPSLRQTQHTPPIVEEPGDIPQPLQPLPQPQASKRTSWAGAIPSALWKGTSPPGSPARTNASASHSRRHSSIDFGTHPDLELSSVSNRSPQNKPSIDRSSVAGTGSTLATTPTSSIRPSAKAGDGKATLPTPTQEQSPLDVDRGYFSGNDMDSVKVKNRLSKTARSGHSRQTSLIDQPSKRTSMIKRHARLSSVGSVREDSPLVTSLASSAYHNKTKLGRFRSASARSISNPSSPMALTPAVTNLENETSPTIGSPAVEKMKMQDKARKLMGFRATSEAVTPEEKSNAAKATPSTESRKPSESLASPATGDTTPSASPSMEMEAPDGVDVSSALSKYASRPRPKNKQRTSAYTHGLLKIPPSEARKTCDYSGWMKKKASGLITTWKPRLFILRGRRLSYYYSENDKEERGVIDISGHKVLVANDDPMLTIHASVTGASKGSSMPRISGATSSPSKSTTQSGYFYFKLVPPKSGMSRAVQFTKPAIHYFQVDSLVEGRKWMGEILKATIEHDLASFETTNRQKTISLAKARARRERPPELDDTKKDDETRKDLLPEKKVGESGLGIDFENHNIKIEGDEISEAASPKALSTLGLGPKTSLKKKNHPLEEDKKLSIVPSDDEKEETTQPDIMTVATDSKT